MYSVHAYYLSMVSQILSFGWMYPAIITICTFYCYGFEYDSAADLFTYMAILLLLYLGGIFFGLFCGTLTDNEAAAILIGNMSIMLFNFGAGCLANTGGDMNPII